MAVIYIREQGTTLTKAGDRLRVMRGGHTLLDKPVFGIESVALFGNVQISSQALWMLMERGVDISYFTYDGKYLGHTASDTSRNIFLRMQQYDLYMDLEKRDAIAKRIVANKIENQISVIEYYDWTGDFDWKADTDEMRRHLAGLADKSGQQSLMGVEGICSNIYFHSYGQMFKCDMEFEKRTRRPPKNPINVILSLAYTLLTKEVAMALTAESFETHLGFLHGIRYGRKSLALDIVEEFRQPAVDRLVLKVFNKGIIGKYDFDYPEGRPVELNEEGFRRFCTAYEHWMNGSDTASSEKCFRSRIRDQAAALKKAVIGGEAYLPYSWEERNVCSLL